MSSDSSSSPTPAPGAPARGAGRGALIRQLMELSTSASSSSNNTSPSPTNFDEPERSITTADSGIYSSRTPISMTSGRGYGRGRLTEPPREPRLPTQTNLVSKGGVGRSKLVDMLKTLHVEPPSRQSEEEKMSTTSTSSSEKESPVPFTNRTNDKSVQQQQELSDGSITSRRSSERELEVVHRTGTSGKPINIMTNYIRLRTDQDKGIYEYEVRFSPNIHSRNLRFILLNQQRSIIGNTKSFDGTLLYLPTMLPDSVTELSATNTNDNTPISIKIIFKRKSSARDCVHFYNVLFDRLMKQMNMVRFGRKKFDPSAPKIIPQHKLEVWPGYVTAVDEYEGGVMLCLDVSHRVLCQTTVHDLLQNAARSDRENYQKNILNALLGSVVLTRYNNRTYRIDDVNFDSSPKATFTMNDRVVSYIDYYKSQYNIDIRDANQPLLIHNEERKIIGKTEKELVVFALIPEICYLTGLTDEMRNDHRVMRDIATFTRVTPNQRNRSFQEFCHNVNSVPEAREILENWGLHLDSHAQTLQARQLPLEDIIFGNGIESAGPNADFNRALGNQQVLCAVNITDWLVIYTKNDQKSAREFMEMMQRNSRPMGVEVARPQVEILDSDRTELYVQTLRRCINRRLQIVVILCPTSRDDRYAAIKKVCCAELPIPSQVINSRTLSNASKNRAIVQKIALQMNCKMGGTLWSIKIPFQNVMICGIDTFHDAAKKQDSVSAFVASLNSTYTRWYSRAVLQKAKEELMNGLCASFIAALTEYRIRNEHLPEKIIIFRDGVGDGQLTMCREYEIPQMLAACRAIEPNYEPKFTFIVVQKRINTRMFAVAPRNTGLENPLPGVVLDHTITRRHLYDFFLVPQSVRQGTVSPTHYIVVYDTSDYAPDILQRLSYKLCFLYYNWPGTIRVPACCQYAHKLAFLVGQSIKRPTAESLGDKLFYL